MKDLIYAILTASGVFTFMHILLFRRYQGSAVFLAAGALGIVAYGAYAASVEIGWTGHLAAAFWYLAVVLTYLEFFSMMCRGFSFHIVKLLCVQGPMSAQEIMNRYGDGSGPAWLIQKRIDGIVAAGFVKHENGFYSVESWKGRLVLKAGNLYKRSIRMSWSELE